MHDVQSPTLGFSTTLDLPLADAISRTQEALTAEGFGVLTTIDVRQTLQTKLGVAFDPYVILGACNPPLAYRALQAAPALGLLLPCNVTLHEHDDATTVSIVDPAGLLGVVGDNAELEVIAEEARTRLRRVVSALGGPEQ